MYEECVNNIMNQILQYVMLIGVSVTIFTLIMSYANNTLEFANTSQHDKTELMKNQAGELLKPIDVIHSPSLLLDVMNLGLEDIKIKKLMVDGVSVTFTIDGKDTKVIPNNGVVSRINPTPNNGTIISILTDNYKMFTFK